MRKAAFRKLHSRSGASLLLALLLFLVCAVAGSVVLAAASASAGRASSADTEANRQRYSLESAADMISDDLSGDSSAAVSFTQSWNVRSVTSNFVATGSADGSLSTSTDRYFDTDSATTNVPERVSFGDFVPALDQSAPTESYDSGEAYTELQDTGEKTSYSWTDTAAFVSSGGKITGVSGGIHSFLELRNLMAEGIFRHYWYAMNGTDADTAEGLQSPETVYSDSNPLLYSTANDPWHLGAPTRSWEETVRSAGNYTIQSDTPFTITLDAGENDSKVETVCADVSMDQDFVLTIHLYCEDSTGLELHLTQSPEETPDLSFAQTDTKETSDPYDGQNVYLKQGTLSTAAVRDHGNQSLQEAYPGYTLANIVWGNRVSGNLYHVTFDYYEKIDVTKTITQHDRSVSLGITYGDTGISSIGKEGK